MQNTSKRSAVKKSTSDKRLMRRYYIITIVSYVSLLFVGVVGIVCNPYVEQYHWILNKIAAWALLAAVLWYILCSVAYVVYSHIVKRWDHNSVRSMLFEKRDHIQDSAKKMKRQLCILRVISDTYAVLLAAFSVGMVLVSCLAFDAPVIFSYPVSVCLMYAALMRIRFSVDTKTQRKEKCILRKSEYPYLYSMVNRAKNTLSCNIDTEIVFTHGNNLGIIYDGSTAQLVIGAVLTDILSEKEFYNALLHEFAHINSRFALSQQEVRYYDLVKKGGNHSSAVVKLMSKLYGVFDSIYMYRYDIYLYAASLANESDADDAVKKHGETSHAASMLLKLGYFNIHEYETEYCDHPSFFEAETFDTTFYRRLSASFLSALPQKETHWRELIHKQILSRTATHPTTQMRLEDLGESKAEVLPNVKSDEYQAEIEKANVRLGQFLLKRYQATYAADREIEYIDRLQYLSRWEQEGCPLSAYDEVVNHLFIVGKASAAEAVCDRVLCEKSSSESGYAYLIKGLFMLHRYDDQGIDYIYKAIQRSDKYFLSGMEAIGTYCCRTGNRDQLERYRQAMIKKNV